VQTVVLFSDFLQVPGNKASVVPPTVVSAWLCKNMLLL